MNQSFLNKKLTIQEKLQLLFNTSMGERWMYPNYGSDLEKYLFQHLNEHSFNAIERSIKQILIQHEPSILISKVDIQMEANGNGIHLQLFYKNGTRSDQQLNLKV